MAGVAGSFPREEELLERYPDTGRDAVTHVREWSSGSLPLVDATVVEQFVAHGELDLVHDAFWRRLPFGTGGVRGTVGIGPNRINETVIGLTAQAHCDFLRKHVGASDGQTIVVANDVRRFQDLAGAYTYLSGRPLHRISSRSLAKLVARVYVANGFTVSMTAPGEADGVLATPELSFLIRDLEAVGGVNLSASHNPPDDNGIKVYDDLGGQYLPPFDELLADAARDVTRLELADFDDAVRSGLVRDIPAEALDHYLALYLAKGETQGLKSRRRTPLVFTPLNGCAERTVGKVLAALGYEVLVPPGQGPDGTFARIPLLAPNPEVPESTEPSRRWAEDQGRSVVLAADPDGDRLGVDVLRAPGEWTHVSGNQLASVLAYFLLLDPAGPGLRGPVYETLVTTLCVSTIARRAGAAPVVDDLLVGFKYIAGAVHEREQELGPTASPDEVLSFAAEESHGYLVSSELRDKDAVSAAIYLATLVERLEERNESLLDYLRDVYDEVGRFGDSGRSVILRGSQGVALMAQIMRSLRADPPSQVMTVPVVDVVDHWDEDRFGPFKSDTDRQARNVLVLALDAGRITFRPSGTEPKLKIYVQSGHDMALSARPEAAPQEIAEELATWLYGEVLGRIGRRLSGAALLLPDVMSLEAKEAFDTEIVPSLCRGLEDPGIDLRALRAETDRRLQALIPGSDALGVVAAAVRAALGETGASDAARARWDSMISH